MKRKVMICECGGDLYLRWSMHCTGSFQHVNKEFEGFGEEMLEMGSGGIQGSPHEWVAVCNSCGNEYEDLEELEEIEVEINDE